MALTRTNLANAGDTTTRSLYTTASFSVAAGDLVIAFFGANYSNLANTVSPPTLSATLTGITWTHINGQRWTAAGLLDRVDAWYGVCSGASTGTLSFTCPGSSAGAGWSVFSYTGHDTGAPVSAGVPFIDTDAVFGPTDVSALTGSLTVWGSYRNTNSTGSTHTGATLIHDVVFAAPTRNLITFEKAAENSPAVTWTPATPWNAGGVAFKIREASVGGITVTPGVVAATFTAPTPGALAASTVTPSAAAAVDTVPAPIPVVVSPATTTPGVVAATFTAPTPSGLMQTIRPVTDSAPGPWTTDTGATTGLAAALFDLSESNYVQSEMSPVTSPYVVGLEPAVDPVSSTGHVVSWSHRNTETGDVDLTVELRQGYIDEESKGTLIASWTETTLPDPFTTVTHTLTGPQADSITNYGALFLRFVATET